MAVNPIEIKEYDHNIYSIDLQDTGVSSRTCSYLIRAQKNILIETGSSKCHDVLLLGLKALNVSLDSIDYVLITHIHLDHSGGLGKLMPALPFAKAIVHPRAFRHLVDPQRLLEGARLAWGDQLDKLFGEVVPVAKDRIIPIEDSYTLGIDQNRSLTFLHTPGHAKHHLSIYDNISESVFCGDTLGVLYPPDLTGLTKSILFPTTSPSDFNPDDVLLSIQKINALHPVSLFHAHFGQSTNCQMVYDRITKMVYDYDSLGKLSYQKQEDASTLAMHLRDYMNQDLQSSNLYLPTQCLALDFDIMLNARGILHRHSLGA